MNPTEDELRREHLHRYLTRVSLNVFIEVTFPDLDHTYYEPFRKRLVARITELMPEVTRGPYRKPADQAVYWDNEHLIVTLRPLDDPHLPLNVSSKSLDGSKLAPDFSRRLFNALAEEYELYTFGEDELLTRYIPKP